MRGCLGRSTERHDHASARYVPSLPGRGRGYTAWATCAEMCADAWVMSAVWRGRGVDGKVSTGGGLAAISPWDRGSPRCFVDARSAPAAQTVKRRQVRWAGFRQTPTAPRESGRLLVDAARRLSRREADLWSFSHGADVPTSVSGGLATHVAGVIASGLR